jgi:cell division protein FtsW
MSKSRPQAGAERMSMARIRGAVEAARLKQDGVLLLAVGLLLGFGVVMVASSSLHLGARSGDALRYVDRHLVALALGVIGALLVYATPTRWWQKGSTWLYFVGLGMLLLVFVPGLGREANGAMRWVAAGPLSLQTSEFMKLFIVMYMAGYVVRRQLEVAHTVWGFIKPLILLLAACALIMLQPDFGTTAVLLATAFGMLFLAGAPLWQFGLLITLAAGALATLIYVSPYRLARVTSFLNPWEQAQDAGYQLSQALIAFGRGEWTGVGLGNGIQKQFYLPEAHTDFVMAVIGEEFGLLGTLLVVFLFSLVIWRAFAIGVRAEKRDDRFSAHVAYGLGLWIGMQAYINIGVNMGLLPTKGLTLPFISYGSNSLIVCCLAVGMLMRIHHENGQTDALAREGTWQRA